MQNRTPRADKPRSPLDPVAFGWRNTVTLCHWYRGMPNRLSLEVLPEGLAVGFDHGAALSEALARLGVPVNYPCGRRGTCGKCRVQFLDGAPPVTADDAKHLDAAALDAGLRLACAAHLTSSCLVEIPGTTRIVEPRILTSSAGREVALQPLVRRYFLEVPLATVERPRADHELVAEILHDAFGIAARPTLPYLQKLPRTLQQANRAVTLTLCGDEIIDADAGNRPELFGLAVDVGTTTIAASLHSLRTGERLAVGARLNLQVEMGADIVSRLSYVFESPERLRTLQERAAGCINHLVRELCASAAVSLDAVEYVTIAGNTVMNHLLLAVPPEHIGMAPYTPVFRHTRLWRGDLIGLQGSRELRACVLPNIGGFVGGDTVAGLLVCDFLDPEEPVLFVDIGTNCEVVLGARGQLLASSAPAGPALEGGCISCGMRAEPGAISDVTIRDGLPVLHTIDDQPARGLCGSGLVHLVAALRELNLVHGNGAFAESDVLLESSAREWFASRLRDDENGKRRLLVAAQADGAECDVWLTQRDVREFQLAKAAIAAAWQTLCHETGVDPRGIDTVYIAGAFGNYIRPEAARLLGMVPEVALERIRSVGNTALEGARLVLLNDNYREMAERILAETRFIELAGREDFQETFALEMSL